MYPDNLLPQPLILSSEQQIWFKEFCWVVANFFQNLTALCEFVFHGFVFRDLYPTTQISVCFLFFDYEITSYLLYCETIFSFLY